MPYQDLAKRRECARRWRQRAYARNPAHFRDIYKKYKDRNREKVRIRRFKQKYGLSPEAWATLFWSQNGCCAVCGRPEVKKRGGYLHVDHNHATGKIRGLLCSACNRSAGFMKDSAEMLRKLAAYLEERS